MRLEPGAEQTIRVVMDSAKAPAAECWAAAVVETVQPGENAGQRVTYVVRTAVKIYVLPAETRANGEIQTLRIADHELPGGTIASSIEVLFCNTGTRHVVTTGAVEIRQADNTLVSRIPLPPVYALPGAHHTARVPMPKLPPGHYVFLATMDYGGADIAAALLEHRAR
jgi:P pilus assembly chaperone PapD